MEETKVFTDDDREVTPGSDEVGKVAAGGNVPIGYYKDEAKSAQTFVVIDGERYSIPGDWCTVEADGTLTLLGRGSVCINTAGEKVYPEEVEHVLRIGRREQRVHVPAHKPAILQVGLLEVCRRVGGGLDGRQIENDAKLGRAPLRSHSVGPDAKHRPPVRRWPT